MPSQTLAMAWSVQCYPCHLKEVCREQYSQGRITSDVPTPLRIQAVKDWVCARGKDTQNLNAQLAAQMGMGLVRAFCAKNDGVSVPSCSLRCLDT